MFRRIDVNKENVNKTANQSLTSLKNPPRKTIHRLQPAATDKENLVAAGRVTKVSIKPTAKDKQLVKSLKPSIAKASANNKQKKVTHKATASSTPIEIDTKDLTILCVRPDNFWQLEAERQGHALQEALEENVNFHRRVDNLEESIRLHRQMVNETGILLEILRKIIERKHTNEDSVLNDSGHQWVGG